MTTLVSGDLIRVVIADDIEAIPVGYARLFESAKDIEIVDLVTHETQVLASIEHHEPHVLLLDINWIPDTTKGIEICELIHTRFPLVRIIAISVHPDLLLMAKAKGAIHVLEKRTRHQDIIEAIRYVMHLSYPTAIPIRVELTNREKEVLLQIAEGYTTAEIGKKLYIGTATVTDYVNSLKAKLGATSRAHLVRLAIQAGLLD